MCPTPNFPLCPVANIWNHISVVSHAGRRATRWGGRSRSESRLAGDEALSVYFSGLRQGAVALASAEARAFWLASAPGSPRLVTQDWFADRQTPADDSRTAAHGGSVFGLFSDLLALRPLEVRVDARHLGAADTLSVGACLCYSRIWCRSDTRTSAAHYT